MENSSVGSNESNNISGISKLGPQNLCDSLRHWSTQSRDKTAFIELGENLAEVRRISFGELDFEVNRISSKLSSIFNFGERIFLAQDSGIDFAITFLACLDASLICVPAPTSHGHKTEKDWASIDSIVKDCSPAGVFIDDHNKQFWNPPSNSEAKNIKSFSLKNLDTLAITLSHSAKSSANDIACLLYTSGSTGKPKGVIYSNRNFIEICERVRCKCKYDENSIALTWQLPSHITGLISAFGEPVFSGSCSVIMPVLSFMTSPMAWLKTINRFHITHSGGPSFAYETCSKAYVSAENSNLDLASWRVAFVAADNVRASVLECFTETFKPHNFRHQSFQACYGLSEAFRIATSTLESGPIKLDISKASIATGFVVVCGLDYKNRHDITTLIGHGPLSDGSTSVKIVNNTARSKCCDLEIGEIWVTGRGIASGYWSDQAESKNAFEATLIGNDELKYLRTGDLGFSHNNSLYIVGRLKELIIIRGRNLHPIDVENSILTLKTKPKIAACVATSIEVDGEEKLILIIEISDNETSLSTNSQHSVMAEVRRIISLHHGTYIWDIKFTLQGKMPRTSSNKISRAQCKSAYLNQTLPEVIIVENDDREDSSSSQLPRTPLENQLHQIWRDLLRQELLGIHDSFFSYGGDSLLSVQVASRIRSLGYEMSPLMLFQYPTIAELAKNLRLSQESLSEKVNCFSGKMQLLPTQAKALRIYDSLINSGESVELDYLAIPKYYRFGADVAVSDLEKIVNSIICHHEAFRTNFLKENGRWVQVVSQHNTTQHIQLLEFDKEWSDAEDRATTWFASLLSKWDISKGSLLKFALVRAKDCLVLMMASNHLVSDNVSEYILSDDFLNAFEQVYNGEEIKLTNKTTRLNDWTVFLNSEANKELGLDEIKYWDEIMRSGGSIPVVGSNSMEKIHRIGQRFMFAKITAADIYRAAFKLGSNAFEIMLSALEQTMREWASLAVRIDIAHHGRPLVGEGIDLSRTAGLMYYDIPFLVTEQKNCSGALAFENVKRSLRSIPSSGLNFVLNREAEKYKHWQKVSPVGVNYQRFTPNRSLTGLPIIVESSLGDKVYQKVIPSRYLELYYSKQMRWFLQDFSGKEMSCYITFSRDVVDISTVTSLFAMFEDKLLSLLNMK